MIWMYEAQTGGGKSYYMTKDHILPAIRAGRKVITNIPLKLDAFRDLYPGAERLIELYTPVDAFAKDHPFSSGDKIKAMADWRGEYVDGTGARITGGPLFCIDEVQFHAGKTKDRFDVSLEDFVNRHRHWLTDLVFASQRMSAVNRALVENAHNYIIVRSNEAIGMGRDTHRYVKKDRFNGEVVTFLPRVKYLKDVFNYYKSQQHADKGAKESDAGVWRWKFFFKFHWLLLYFVIALFIVLSLTGVIPWNFFRALGGNVVGPEPSRSMVVQAPAPLKAQPVVAVTAPTAAPTPAAAPPTTEDAIRKSLPGRAIDSAKDAVSNPLKDLGSSVLPSQWRIRTWLMANGRCKPIWERGESRGAMLTPEAEGYKIAIVQAGGTCTLTLTDPEGGFQKSIVRTMTWTYDDRS